MMAARILAGAALPPLACALSSSAAFAHHPVGGTTPTTLMHGLLSGIGHPVLGLDHFAFVVGIGLLAGSTGLGLRLPALFVAAMTAGFALHVVGIDIPYVEWLVALSVAGLGLVIWQCRETGSAALGLAFAAAGLLHGFALAETAIGAEPTPLIAYLIGLCVAQMAIASIAWQVAGGHDRFRAGTPGLVPAYVRITGLAVAVVGVGYVFIAARALA